MLRGCDVTSWAAAELRGGSAGCRRVAESSVISAGYANENAKKKKKEKKVGWGVRRKGRGWGGEERSLAGSLAQARAHVAASSP